MQAYILFPVLIYAALVELFNCQKIRDDFCTDKEIRETGCIHGKCFVVILGGSREASCHCDKDYAGIRCQELNLELISFGSREEYAKSNVYIIVGVIVLVAILAFIIVFICYRRMTGLPISDIFDKKRQSRQLLSTEEERAELHNSSNNKKPETWTETDKSNDRRL